MDGIWLLLALIVGAVVLGTPILALIAFLRSGDQRQAIESLQDQIKALRTELAARPAAVVPQAVAAPPQDELPPVIEPATEAQPEIAAPLTSVPPPPPQPVEPAVAPLPPLLTPTQPAPPPAPAMAARAPGPSLEQRLGARVFVWLGGITLALAAIFLVHYSIEQGYLSPEVRVVMAALFGVGLIAGAGYLRSRDDRVAQALAAAGAAALYGALFSAAALYNMVSPAVAIEMALALTFFCIVLSLRHGIFVAALAFVGGFVSPIVIGGDSHNVPALFGYLFATAAGTLAMIRY
ncbi:MAG: DUF2339 domain-containing protein, partial [Alphaproteobacteria bacterium]|nr:DUF2339 domain-containing protein [Alphaproteobacteria bacterium]